MSKDRWYYSKNLREMTTDELVEVIEDHQLLSEALNEALEFLDIINDEQCTIEVARALLKKSRLAMGFGETIAIERENI